MLITTSRRPSRLARVLCRELVQVLPGSRYVPRGVKTVEDVAIVARKFGHDRAMILESASGKPREIRFLEIGQNWRWADAVMELGEVKLHPAARRKGKIGDVSMYADGSMAIEFAEWFGGLLGVGRSDEMPKSGGVVLITSDAGLSIHFKRMPGSEAVGPEIKVVAFGNLFGGGLK